MNGQAIIDSMDVSCGFSLEEYIALALVGAFRSITSYEL